MTQNFDFSRKNIHFVLLHLQVSIVGYTWKEKKNKKTDTVSFEREIYIWCGPQKNLWFNASPPTPLYNRPLSLLWQGLFFHFFLMWSGSLNTFIIIMSL